MAIKEIKKWKNNKTINELVKELYKYWKEAEPYDWDGYEEGCERCERTFEKPERTYNLKWIGEGPSGMNEDGDAEVLCIFCFKNRMKDFWGD